jgi:hypothetical protein
MEDIPTYDHSKPDFDAAPKPSFHYYAGRISLLAPIIATAFVRSLFWGLKDVKTTWSVLIAVVVSFLLAVIYLLSIILGLVALTGMSREGNEGTLRRSILGVVISGALLGFWSVGFVHGYQTGMKNRKAAQAITQATHEINKDLTKEVAEKGSVTPSASKDNAQKMKTALDNASKQMTGDDALVARAGSGYMGRLQKILNDYTAAAQTIRSPSMLSMNGVGQREQLAARKEAVNKFLAANEKLMSFFTKAETIFREELARAKVPPALLDATLKGYRGTADERNFLQVQIRMTDQRIGNAMLGMLDLLDSNWGNWKYNPEKENVTFQDTSAIGKYNDYVKDMNDASKEQAQLQSKLVNLPAIASVR